MARYSADMEIYKVRIKEYESLCKEFDKDVSFQQLECKRQLLARLKKELGET